MTLYFRFDFLSHGSSGSNANLTYTSHLLLNELQLHVLDLDPHKQEVNLAHNDVLEVVPGRRDRGNLQQDAARHVALHIVMRHDGPLLGLVVLKLDVQAVLNSHLHLDRVVHVWVGGELVDDQLILLHQVRQATDYCHPEEVPAVVGRRMH